MRKVFLIPCLLLATLPNAAHGDSECLAVEQAFATNQIEALAALQIESPRWQALQKFRLAAAYIPAEQKRQARRVVLDGLKVVNAALSEAPEDVEMLLMGAMLDGQILLLSPWRFFHNGLRGMERLRNAEALAPDNPRATLIRSTAQVILPGVLGGDAAQAAEAFSAALAVQDDAGQQFADRPLCEGGEWAQVDLLNWLGRAHHKLGDHEAAQAAYARALDRSPDNHWVKLAIEGRGYEWDDGAAEPIGERVVSE